MHMQVEDVLIGGFAILLDYGDAVGFGAFLDCDCYMLGDVMHLRKQIFWYIENGLIMTFGYYQRMTFAEWPDV